MIGIRQGIPGSTRRRVATFDPAALAGVAPTVYVDPRVLVLSDGSAVASIANSGSAGGTFAQGTTTLQPLVRNNLAGGGKHAIDFDGVDDRMFGPMISGVYTTSWTMIAVLELDGLVASQPSPWQDATAHFDSGGYTGLTLRSNAGTPQVGCYRLTTGAAYATMGGVGTRQVVAASYDHATGTLLAQAGLSAPVTAVGTPDATQTGVAGVGGYGPVYLDGKVFAVCVWNSALSTASREAVIAAARRFWGTV